MLVISLGGSILSKGEMDLNYIKKFREFMDSLNEKVFLVVGGGRVAREYISAGKEMGFDEYFLDKIGIVVTRLNGMLFITPQTYPQIPETVEEAIIASRSYKNVVMGGTEPGHTTDAVSLLLAEKLHVKRVINITSVGGVYNRDPAKFKNAEIIKEMSYGDAKKMILTRMMGAGLNIPFDLLAIKIAERSRIKIYVVPEDIENLKKVIKNEDFKGTVIGISNR